MGNSQATTICVEIREAEQFEVDLENERKNGKLDSDAETNFGEDCIREGLELKLNPSSDDSVDLAPSPAYKGHPSAGPKESDEEVARQGNLNEDKNWHIGVKWRDFEKPILAGCSSFLFFRQDNPKLADSEDNPKQADSQDNPKQADSHDNRKQADSQDEPQQSDSQDNPKQSGAVDNRKRHYNGHRRELVGTVDKLCHPRSLSISFRGMQPDWSLIKLTVVVGIILICMPGGDALQVECLNNCTMPNGTTAEFHFFTNLTAKSVDIYRNCPGRKEVKVSIAGQVFGERYDLYEVHEKNAGEGVLYVKSVNETCNYTFIDNHSRGDEATVELKLYHPPSTNQPSTSHSDWNVSDSVTLLPPFPVPDMTRKTDGSMATIIAVGCVCSAVIALTGLVATLVLWKKFRRMKMQGQPGVSMRNIENGGPAREIVDPTGERETLLFVVSDRVPGSRGDRFQGSDRLAIEQRGPQRGHKV